MTALTDDERATFRAIGAAHENDMRRVTAERDEARAERDGYRASLAVRFALRAEVERALDVPSGTEGDESLRVGIERIAALKSERVAALSLLRVALSRIDPTPEHAELRARIRAFLCPATHPPGMVLCAWCGTK